jgi:hypothetical protein
MRDLPSTDTAALPASAPRTGSLAWLLRSLGVVEPEVIVYLPPGGDGNLEAMEQRLRRRDDVVDTRTVDVEQTYEDFRRLFAEQENMLDSVRPEDLPTSVWVTVEDDLAARRLAEEYRPRDDVYEVRFAEGIVAPAGAFVSTSDRRHWKDLARRLDRVEGHPAWAEAAAATLRDLLSRGVKRVGSDDRVADRTQTAIDGVTKETDRCS